ncbi:uncharacterized protein [Periplaneta americana]|uniref:uncharacterized protein n=1 Tax=Periplaneta americana TaxID=6978 RepID=UPI0037E9C25E
MQARLVAVLLVVASTTVATPLAEDSERSLRIGSNSAATTATDNTSTGYSVSFVPLFSILANFIPRLFSRFSGVNQASAREFGEWEERDYNYIQANNSFCSPSHIGQWEDTINCRRFYVCEQNTKAPPHCKTTNEQSESSSFQTMKNHLTQNKQVLQIESLSTSCLTMTVYQCPDRFLYSKEVEKCVAQESDELC